MIEQQTIEQQTKATNSNYIRVPYACEIYRHKFDVYPRKESMPAWVPYMNRLGVEYLSSKHIDWRLNDIVLLRVTLVFENINQPADTSLGTVAVLLGVSGTSPLQKEEVSRFDIMAGDVYAGGKLSRPVVVYETLCKKVVNTPYSHAFKLQSMNFVQDDTNHSPPYDEFTREGTITIEFHRNKSILGFMTVTQRIEAFYVGTAQGSGDFIYDM